MIFTIRELRWLMYLCPLPTVYPYALMVITVAKGRKTNNDLPYPGTSSKICRRKKSNQFQVQEV